MNKKTKYYAILFLLLITNYMALELVLSHFSKGDVCPILMGIPACYIVALLFIIALITQVLKKWPGIFYLCIGFLFILALFATVGEIGGVVHCPRMFEIAPMCFVSFGLCTVLLYLKIMDESQP